MGTAYIVAATRTAGGKRDGRVRGWHPVDLAAETALRTVATRLEATSQLEQVKFVLFDQGTFGGYARVLETMLV